MVYIKRIETSNNMLPVSSIFHRFFEEAFLHGGAHQNTRVTVSPGLGGEQAAQAAVAGSCGGRLHVLQRVGYSKRIDVGGGCLDEHLLRYGRLDVDVASAAGHGGRGGG